ncbi:right-handed parallel beta-helix repeat-containing protein [Puniceicoccales bacterium CK1056]|uniref:Right-handed parallel beta-helix repeat-containing protein n=1 Tax=Oceanipulchritudo coccoides TaxID=2706888 RepID=A0A6B2LX19_9BACT|nr:right-handed parallel beta-helix repeat-containing protein [Oceanipulchritudo coccoides]NDV61021.1 right-handed parallel beta-helix repeat-containing protein [Oceanipulchritudo coccoides]
MKQKSERPLKRFLGLVALPLMALALPSSSALANIVSLNVASAATCNNTSVSSPFGIATEGTVVGNWNNTSSFGALNPTANLVNDQGVGTGISATILNAAGQAFWGASYIQTPWNYGIAHYVATPNPVEVTLDNLNTAFPTGYVAIVYVNGAAANPGAAITDGTTTYYFQTSNPQNTTPILITDTNSGDGYDVGNYAKFGSSGTPLTSDTITFTIPTGSVVANNAGIGGIQIVGVPFDLAPPDDLVASTYYVDPVSGSDLNSGTSAGSAWQTLGKVNNWNFGPGDQILLKAGATFMGKIVLSEDNGAAGNPIVVASYGAGAAPIIDASGYLAGVVIRDSEYIEVRDIEITGDGGAMVDGSPETNRYGVYAKNSSCGALNNIILDNLFIHDIYPNVGTASDGATATTHQGFGISMDGGDATLSQNIQISNCVIDTVGFKGIELKKLGNIEVIDNQLQDIGGPGIQVTTVSDLVVRGNSIDSSGSFVDSRMHGRGSGIWPYGSDRVLIEKNTVQNALGKADSCGIHIDSLNNDVVVQYNLSINNAGGFIEILGKNVNCAYRYNISINDGARVVGQPSNGPGTLNNVQPGQIIWTSGYNFAADEGPTNSYLYNNTIYVGTGITGNFNIHESTDGLLIANNIFYVVDPTADVTPAGLDDYTVAMADRVVWNNNLYQTTGIVPTFNLDLFGETGEVIGDPLFANTGGLTAADYIPSSTTFVEDQGIAIPLITGDTVGLLIGLEVATDYFGNPVIGLPDMGAIEIGGTPFPIPAAAFASNPAAVNANSVTMTSVEGPLNTEYYFVETSGNFGGDDSGWQSSPVYVDDGLLPNTTYSYTVTLRDVLDAAGAPSAAESVTTPVVTPFDSPVVLDEGFSSEPNPINTSLPWPEETWFLPATNDATKEVDNFSVFTFNGGLQTGYGYDETLIYWYSSLTWDLARDYRFTGDWEIKSVLANTLGLIVGIGEFDPSTGALIQRVKEVTTGELVTPVVGQTGSFNLSVTSTELATAGVSSSNRVGVFLQHDDEGTLGTQAAGSNDVYIVDNLRLTGTIDRDGDGIDDTDEPGLGLDPNNPDDGAEDLDGDSFSNHDEYLTGTGLNDPADFLSPALTASPTLADLLVPGSSVLNGRVYILEQSTTLGGWTAVDAVSGSDAPGLDILFQVVDPDATSFFRTRVEWE